MDAIVLAGGLGTRLKSVVSDLPKPMAPIGDQPFLAVILRYLQHNGVQRVILSVGYKWESIHAYFGEHFEGLSLIYSVEDEPLGTGGAIKQALVHAQSDAVFIINGDTFFNVPLHQLIEAIQAQDKLILSLKPMQLFDRYGSVDIDSHGMVTAFAEKTFKTQGNINGGIYLAAKNIFDSYVLAEKFSFEQFMEQHFSDLKIKALLFDQYFIDIGIPEDYARAQLELKDQL